MTRALTLLVHALAFLIGYALVSRYLTGGGIVDVRLITRGEEPTYTVVASLLAGVAAVLIWRIALWAARASQRHH